ncbi:putative Zn-binding protein involved in type VI secretion [Massilia aurea]|uniref:Putative Zn-binding protein involved in type VI secretion n=1 Tax=Massilia aurea TaxID=373040 RepID=A0A7X0CCD2_9BURK|nr:PAAR domain-containing protein [Massilia aurea]MBB6132955.1 putative Zn-binding protein involved in type VI secretion [Massilia aurea]
MAMRAVICKGDPTSHGGVVLEGNLHSTAQGRPIASKGHMTQCPLCKGTFPIAEGLAFHTHAGIGTAVEGMKTVCGAVLIATTTKGFLMIDDQSEAATAAAAPIHAATAPAAANFGTFRAVDEDSGKPVPGLPYRIELPDGAVRRGVTDADGFTERVAGHDPASVKLHWETDGTVEEA